jgi:hypothetical protein
VVQLECGVGSTERVYSTTDGARCGQPGNNEPSFFVGEVLEHRDNGCLRYSRDQRRLCSTK